VVITPLAWTAMVSPLVRVSTIHVECATGITALVPTAWVSPMGVQSTMSVVCVTVAIVHARIVPVFLMVVLCMTRAVCVEE
jgi:hypothetical protein